jgi:hypothetical protein
VEVPLNSTTTLSAVVNGDFEVDLAYQGTQGRLYLNGHADCFTASGTTATGS